MRLLVRIAACAVLLIAQSSLANASPYSLFPSEDVLSQEADSAYGDFLSGSEWKLTSFSSDSGVKKAKYQASMMIAPPTVSRIGLLSWRVNYRFQDRYKVGLKLVYACRDIDIDLQRMEFLGAAGPWSHKVAMRNRFDLSTDPCGAMTDLGVPGDPAPNFVFGRK